MMTMKQIAEKLGVSKSTVQRAVKAGQIDPSAVAPHKTWLFDSVAVERIAEEVRAILGEFAPNLPNLGGSGNRSESVQGDASESDNDSDDSDSSLTVLELMQSNSELVQENQRLQADNRVLQTDRDALAQRIADLEKQIEALQTDKVYLQNLSATLTARVPLALPAKTHWWARLFRRD